MTKNKKVMRLLNYNYFKTKFENTKRIIKNTKYMQ